MRVTIAEFQVSLKVPLEDVAAIVTKAAITSESEESENGDETSDEAELGEERHELPQTMKVLCVDDCMILRKLFSRIISKTLPGWVVDEAASGETALQMVESCEYDLIFLDQYMTSTDKQLLGTETARALRAKRVKSVICGHSANDMENSFINAGANAFVMKPLPSKKEELTKELARILYDNPSVPFEAA
jgi:CheY-like chemotaxis protein